MAIGAQRMTPFWTGRGAQKERYAKIEPLLMLTPEEAAEQQWFADMRAMGLTDAQIRQAHRQKFPKVE